MNILNLKLKVCSKWNSFSLQQPQLKKVPIIYYGVIRSLLPKLPELQNGSFTKLVLKKVNL